MKFIHAADIHLDSPLRGLAKYEGAPVEELRGATRQAFRNLINLALEDDVDFVLLAGDLYDGDWKDYNTGLFFVQQVSRLREANIPVFLIAGNHDAASQITRALQSPENLQIFSTKKPETKFIESLDVAIHGQGFPTRAVDADLAKNYPDAIAGYLNIGLLHTSLDGRPGHSPYAPCTVDGLKTKGYDYWALGHVHNREIVSEDPWIIFPGNIQGRHIKESGEKGCSLVTAYENEIVSVDHIALDVVRWAHGEIDATAAHSLDDVLESCQTEIERLVQEEGRLVAARMTISGSSHANSVLRSSREHLTAELHSLAADYGHERLWIEKVRIDTRPPSEDSSAMNRDDALGSLLREIRDFELEEGRLDDFSAELASLRSKLPPEILIGEESFDPTSSEVLKELMPDIKEILVEELLTKGTSR